MSAMTAPGVLAEFFAWSVVSFAGFGGGFGGANECSVVIVV